MSAELLVEETRSLLLDEIKANIDAALTAIRNERNDPIVSTEPPISYFIFAPSNILRCPAVIIVVDSADIPEETTGANHINGVVSIFVSVVVEDREADLLTIKAERYQAALFRILHRKTLQDAVKNVKIYSRVRKLNYSPIYTTKAEDPMGEFRKEVVLELTVKHFENPN